MTVHFEQAGHAAYVTLDRPEVLNAMDLQTHVELGHIWDKVAQDDDIWAVLITGTGTRSFSVGQDLKERASLDRSSESSRSTFGSRGRPGFPRITERFDFPKPIVAAINGFALGGGFELAMACDVIVAADHAEFGLPEARLGLIPGAGGVFRLSRQAPSRIAMGHLLTGRRMSASRAYELGLINEVVPSDQLMATARGWLDDIVSSAPLSVRAIKQAAAATHVSLAEAFATRFPFEEQRMFSEDAVEGPRAFAEKRAPVWRAE